ncbi:hypothetical protein V5O48_006264 [Marasmius crinis-equi]|uniref:RING-14 protein n=1 Tax=Marasmius crinis-equi TaxID=585013 RepID=A0ABR3FK65_9AGAR
MFPLSKPPTPPTRNCTQAPIRGDFLTSATNVRRFIPDLERYKALTQMHFSKTYAKLLLDLPPELRENAIQYRQLKKLINQVVSELNLLGLSPTVLQELLEERVREEVDRKDAKGKDKESQSNEGLELTADGDGRSYYSHPRVVYEVNNSSGSIEPRLRVWLKPPSSPSRRKSSHSNDSDRSPSPNDDTTSSSTVDEEALNGDEMEDTIEDDQSEESSNMSLIWALQRRASSSSSAGAEKLRETRGLYTGQHNGPTEPQEIIIPLASDTAFFQLLSTALVQISDHLLVLHGNFVTTLQTLARDIGSTARPVSSGDSYRPHSMLTHPGTIRKPSASNKSDLYSWREILRLYVEAEVFEGVGEAHRGENSVDESERRLKVFAERVGQRGLGDGRELKLKQSRDALQTFLELNMFILNIKKFQVANAEATRKILKKHAKRTALRLPDVESSSTTTKSPASFKLQEQLAGVLFPQLRVADISDLDLDSTHPNSKALTTMGTHAMSYAFASLPRILVQAMGETLLPVIPHIDDYSCAICTSIAFKPIRLNCGHLFCVRCLVKMQKRGQGDCPMCRAPTVLVADRSNVDWALLNFMSDWFPIESRDKLKQSEKEAMEEQLQEWGVDPDSKCVIM